MHVVIDSNVGLLYFLALYTVICLRGREKKVLFCFVLFFGCFFFSERRDLESGGPGAGVARFRFQKVIAEF